MSYQLVADAEALAALVAQLERAPALALDTEGNSFHAYRDRVCLIQLAIAAPGTPESEPAIFLVDPLLIDPAPLAPIFADPAHRIVLHGGDYDVRSLRRDFGFGFGRMFDTMIAAQTLHLPELGLMALLRTELGVTIRKNEQRSDWGRRPLRQEQLDYAALDVRHLLPLAERLELKLLEAKSLDAASNAFEKLRHLTARNKPFDVHGYRRIKGAGALGPTGQRVLRALWLGRDRVSKELDRAPFKVLGEQAMFEIAKRLPQDLEALRQIPGVGDLAVRRLGPEILAAVTEAAP